MQSLQGPLFLIVIELLPLGGGLCSMDLSQWKQFAGRLLARFWTYMGSLPALALMLGVAGMGIYYHVKDSSMMVHSEYFAGFFNEAGEMPPRGIAPTHPLADAPASQVRFDYDAAGRLQRVVHLNSLGQPSLIPGSQVAEQRLFYDDAGRLIEKQNVDAYGLAAADAAGVSKRVFDYDEAGRLLSRSFYNAAGQGIVPLKPGFAVERRSYDEQGRPVMIEFLDAEGKAISNARGESVLRISYSDDGLCAFTQNEVDGKMANNNLGYAIERRLSTKDGAVQRTEWLDADGKLVLNRNRGMAVVQQDGDGTNICTLYLDAQACPLTTPRSICERLVRLNADGQVEWECFNAADGLPCRNQALAYAERVCEYGPDKHLSCEYMWDECGQAAPCYKRSYTPLEEGVQVTSLHRDGSTATEFVEHLGAPLAP
ncbi:MAG: hypothetical protein R3Y56_07160 [Akkermansia sp.]